MENFISKLKQEFKNFGIELTESQSEQFYKYYCLLKEWNEKINLTTIIDEDEVIKKHFLDSVISVNQINFGARIIDIGSGAGFPGIPLKILRDDLNITLVDSVNKKVVFLNEVIKTLNLKNIFAIHSRIEDLANKKEYRERFDFVVSRAVSKLNTLCEYALPFLKINGKLIAYKAFNVDEEIDEAKNAIFVLGGQYVKTEKINFFDMERNFIIVKKIKPTDKKYPRNGNKPRITPII